MTCSSPHQRFVRELNKTYKKYKPLYQLDQSRDGFRWVLADNASDNVLVFERYDKKGDCMLIVVNFSTYDYHNYGFNVENGQYSLVLNSDETKYGGRGVDVCPLVTSDEKGYIEVVMPASSVQYYKKV